MMTNVTFEELRASLRALEDELADREGTINAMREEIQALRAQYADLEVRLADSGDERDTLERTNEELRQKLVEATNARLSAQPLGELVAINREKDVCCYFGTQCAEEKALAYVRDQLGWHKQTQRVWLARVTGEYTLSANFVRAK